MAVIVVPAAVYDPLGPAVGGVTGGVGGVGGVAGGVPGGVAGGAFTGDGALLLSQPASPPASRPPIKSTTALERKAKNIKKWLEVNHKSSAQTSSSCGAKTVFCFFMGRGDSGIVTVKAPLVTAIVLVIKKLAFVVWSPTEVKVLAAVRAVGLKPVWVFAPNITHVFPLAGNAAAVFSTSG